MQIYPTIHIKDGICYNPSVDAHGRPNIYTSSPVKLAKIWEEAGATCLHVIDVDGVSMGLPVSSDLISEIVRSVSIPVQAGGGIRTLRDAEKMLNLGVRRVICGTEAVRNSRFVEEVIAAFGSDRFVAAVDAKNGMVAIEGRERMCKYNPITLINYFAELGVREVIYTDLNKASLQSGPSIENAMELTARTSIDVIYAGGIGSIADIQKVSLLPVSGVIVATALYSGKIDLKEATRLFEKGL